MLNLKERRGCGIINPESDDENHLTTSSVGCKRSDDGIYRFNDHLSMIAG